MRRESEKHIETEGEREREWRSFLTAGAFSAA